MTSKAMLGLGLAAVLTIASPTSEAILYELQTNAEIRLVSSLFGDLSDESQAVLNDWGITVGQTISATYLIDGDASPTIVVDMGETYVVYDSLLEARLTLPNLSAPFENGGPDYSVSNDVGADDVDIVLVRGSQTTQASTGEVLFGVTSVLYSESGNAINDNALDPFDYVDLTAWDAYDDGRRTAIFLGLIFENGEQINVEAEYTFNTVRVVPLPGAGLLLFGALAGLTGFRRRRA
jgi:hypothetical protein